MPEYVFAATRPDHPRGYGDNATGVGDATFFAGPSRVCRDQHGHRAGLGRVRRTTPAGTRTTFLLSVNPRSCCGPPPRVRGRPVHVRSRDHDHRTTPACAGTTRTGPASPPDHPACAGTTSAWRMPAGFPADHPRVCGDDLNLQTKTRHQTGPPPRVRGRLSGVPVSIRPRRTTPACAWTTACTGSFPVPPPDHPRGCGDDICAWVGSEPRFGLPRVCGDDSCLRRSLFRPPGPPPRVRGRPEPGQRRLRVLRTTPACAGTTAPGCQSRRRRTGHPRACGDDGAGVAHSSK